jgi:glyoxylase I family protein
VRPAGDDGQVSFHRFSKIQNPNSFTQPMTQSHTSSAAPSAFIKNVHGVRYQVKDVARAAAFYTRHLGFTLEHQHLPQFAAVCLGQMVLLLSGPDASGSLPLPNGQGQEPGGWNRLVLHTVNLPAFVATLKQVGLRFRNDVVSGPGGSQVQIEDPDGNPIELFEPAK